MSCLRNREEISEGLIGIHLDKNITVDPEPTEGDIEAFDDLEDNRS